GDPQRAAVLRRIPSRAVHFRACQDGRVHQPALAQGPGLHDSRGDRAAQRLADRPGAGQPDRLMYKKILVPLENSPTDATVLAHVRALAEHTGAALVLIHVADGWVARNIEQLQ